MKGLFHLISTPFLWLAAIAALTFFTQQAAGQG